MSIKTICPHCGATELLLDKMDGHTVECWKCKKRFRVGAKQPDSKKQSTIGDPAHNQGSSNENEPWFYSFLEVMAKIVMVAGCFAGLCFIGFGLMSSESKGANGLTFFTAVFAGGIQIIVSITWYALCLLFVDAARNLRAIRISCEPQK